MLIVAGILSLISIILSIIRFAKYKGLNIISIVFSIPGLIYFALILLGFLITSTEPEPIERPDQIHNNSESIVLNGKTLHLTGFNFGKDYERKRVYISGIPYFNKSFKKTDAYFCQGNSKFELFYSNDSDSLWVYISQSEPMYHDINGKNLDKIPVRNLIKLIQDEVIDKSVIDNVLEKAKTDSNSAIVVKDNIIIDFGDNNTTSGIYMYTGTGTNTGLILQQYRADTNPNNPSYGYFTGDNSNNLTIKSGGNAVNIDGSINLYDDSKKYGAFTSNTLDNSGTTSDLSITSGNTSDDSGNIFLNALKKGAGDIAIGIGIGTIGNNLGIFIDETGLLHLESKNGYKISTGSGVELESTDSSVTIDASTNILLNLLNSQGSITLAPGDDGIIFRGNNDGGLVGSFKYYANNFYINADNNLFLNTGPTTSSTTSINLQNDGTTYATFTSEGSEGSNNLKITPGSGNTVKIDGSLSVTGSISGSISGSSISGSINISSGTINCGVITATGLNTGANNSINAGTVNANNQMKINNNYVPFFLTGQFFSGGSIQVPQTGIFMLYLTNNTQASSGFQVYGGFWSADHHVIGSQSGSGFNSVGMNQQGTITIPTNLSGIYSLLLMPPYGNWT
jgi:hypothetical protein